MLARVYLVGTAALALLASAPAQLSGTAETYFQTDAQRRGAQDILSWGELQERVNDYLKATISYVSASGYNALDEACLSLEYGDDLLRLGRIRTAFGFNTWSDYYYNGFNHLPLIRASPLVDNLILSRDDAGGEFTFGGTKLQVQASLIDSELGSYQFAPKQFNTSTARLQTSFGQIILGLDYLWRFVDGDQIAGLDVRWSTPRLLVRGEYMAGLGDGETASGFYVDATYRIPRLERTQLVARYEWFFGRDGGDFMLQTLGLRQVLIPNLTLNVNYCWGSGPGGQYEYGNLLNEPGLQGWSARAMFQIHF